MIIQTRIFFQYGIIVISFVVSWTYLFIYLFFGDKGFKKKILNATASSSQISLHRVDKLQHPRRCLSFTWQSVFREPAVIVHPGETQRRCGAHHGRRHRGSERSVRRNPNHSTGHHSAAHPVHPPGVLHRARDSGQRDGKGDMRCDARLGWASQAGVIHSVSDPALLVKRAQNLVDPESNRFLIWFRWRFWLHDSQMRSRLGYDGLKQTKSR